MPVLHLTLHAYRSWGPDHERGYMKYRDQKVFETDTELAEYYEAQSSQDAVSFSKDHQTAIIGYLQEIISNLDLGLYGVAVTPSHVHFVFSWHGEQSEFKSFSRRIKNVLSLKLSKAEGVEGKKWFSRGWGKRFVENEHYLSELLENYLPKHRDENGIVWINPGFIGARGHVEFR